MLPNPFYESSIVLVTKPHKDGTKKGPMKKILTKTLVTQVQKTIRRIMRDNLMGFSQGRRAGSILESQPM